MKSDLWPKTILGRWSISLIIAAIVLFAAFLLEVALGLRGGDTLDLSDFSQIAPGIPVMLAGVSILSAGITGIISIVKYKERSILVFLALAMGVFALLFILGEFLFPH